MENVRIEYEAPVAWVVIDRPKALNALNQQTMAELSDAFDEIEKRDDIRCVLLTGGGEKAFVAGADIAEMKDLEEQAAKGFAERGHAVGSKMALFPKPIVAVVNGFALGGGTELALACDFIVAGDNAVFGQPEVDLGVIPGFGGTQRLPRKIGPGLAAELVLTGRKIKADEALRIGLVSQVFPAGDLKAEAKKIGETISRKGPEALRLAKEAMRKGLETTLEEGNRIEIDAFAACFRTQDQKEGMAAFVEKRKPAFTGK